MISAEEIARRREAYRQALASNRIEGIEHDPSIDPIFQAWIVGEIEIDEAIERIKEKFSLTAKRHGSRDGT